MSFLEGLDEDENGLLITTNLWIQSLKCDITAHTVLLYVLFCLTYMYCTLYTVRTIHCTYCVHSLFPRADISALRHLMSVRVHSHSLVIHLHSLSDFHILLHRT